MADDDRNRRLLADLREQLRQSRQQEELLKFALTRAVSLVGHDEVT